MRSAAKAVNFGIIYGMSSFDFQKLVHIHDNSQKYIEEYFNIYPRVKLFMQENVESQKQGYLKTLWAEFGTFQNSNPHYTIREFGKRAAMNMPLQGSASDIIKMAMNKVYQKLKEENMKSKLILQVHDELIVDAPLEEEERIKNLLKECMESVVNFKVPLLVNISSGKNWYEAK